MYANWRKKYACGQFKILFWEVVKAFTVGELKNALKKVKDVDVEAYEDLIKRDPSERCRAYFDTHCKVTNVESNTAEVFNWSVIEARTKHIIYMLEEIKKGIMERNHEKSKWIKKKMSVVFPSVMKKIEEKKL